VTPDDPNRDVKKQTAIYSAAIVGIFGGIALLVPDSGPIRPVYTLTWENGPRATIAIIEAQLTLGGPWQEIGRVTNQTSFAVTNNLPREFYRIGHPINSAEHWWNGMGYYCQPD
jgi:hypothetical protein